MFYYYYINLSLFPIDLVALNIGLYRRTVAGVSFSFSMKYMDLV